VYVLYLKIGFSCWGAGIVRKKLVSAGRFEVEFYDLKIGNLKIEDTENRIRIGMAALIGGIGCCHFWCWILFEDSTCVVTCEVNLQAGACAELAGACADRAEASSILAGAIANRAGGIAGRTGRIARRAGSSEKLAGTCAILT
jgi:hypothetical protein